MKKLLPFLMLALSVSTFAQERIKEAGLTFSSLDHFGLSYKTGYPSSLWRFNSIYLSASNSKESGAVSDLKNQFYGFGFRAGREYRKPVIENVELRYGFDLGFTFQHSKQETLHPVNGDYDAYIKRTTYQPGINGVIGFNYLIKERIVLGAEVLPGFSYSTGKETTKSWNTEEASRDISGASFHLSSGGVLLSVALRF